MINTHKPLYVARLEELLTRFCGEDPAKRLNGDTVARILASVCAERERADEAEAFLRKMFDSDDVEGRNMLTSNVLRCLTREHQVSLCTHVLGDEHRELKGMLDARDAEIAYLRRLADDAAMGAQMREAENAQLREAARWRDVREELPPLGVEVWAWIDWLKRAVKMKRVDNGENDGEWVWVDCDGFDDPEWSESPPTQWQLLPKSPKEQL